MTLSNSDLLALIELAGEFIEDPAPEPWIEDCATPIMVRAMAEELLAARAMRDGIDVDISGYDHCINNIVVETYDASRKRNEGK